MTEHDSREATLQRPVRLEDISERLADFIRTCMRATVADNPNVQNVRALEAFGLLLDLLFRQESTLVVEIFHNAIEELRVGVCKYSVTDDLLADTGFVDDEILAAARHGLRLLVESSINDAAGAARAAKCRYAFIAAARRIQFDQRGMGAESRLGIDRN